MIILVVLSLILFVWILSSIYHYQNNKYIKNNKNKSKTTQKKFYLETKQGKGWEYRIGNSDKYNLIGTAKGRSTWIPGTEKDENDRYESKSFYFNREENANASDQVFRDIMMKKNDYKLETEIESEEITSSVPEKAATCAVRGSVFYSRLQTEEGFWAGDYAGPMFLLPGMVIACYVTNIELGKLRKSAMLDYILNHQQEKDGGWGTHIEGISTVFGTSLNYTAARLLGLEKNDPRAIKARDFLKSEGGAIAAPQWAKFWLATLGAYEWTGVNPTPPELWLLPYWFPFHPGKMWCHCRMVYLPMSALFGERYVYVNAEHDPLILSLREELYATKYENINWGSIKVRECVAERDIYNPQTYLMTFANHFLHNTLENPIFRAVFHYPLDYLRKRALEFAYNYVHAEDIHTNFIDIGPVNKAFHVIATYARYGEDSMNFQNHIGRIEDYLWLAEDGMKMQGYNGSILWDTCFATHALATAVMASKQKEIKDTVTEKEHEIVYCSLKKAAKFVDDMQVRENVVQKELYFRDNSDGGWPFSTQDHGWPITDCTAEGLKAAILLQNHFNNEEIPHISQQRLENAVEIILGLQNTQTDNGWASYELNRGYNWYEWLNPAQVFGDIMIDYSYVECSSACVQALCEFALQYPKSKYYEKALQAARSGTEFIISVQRKDGGFYGSWAVCFTYGAWFGVEGLVTALNYAKPNEKQKAKFENALKLGCKFLLDKQNQNDGGWGEDVLSCAKVDWVENKLGTQVIQTAWAIIALVKAAEYFDKNGDKQYANKLIQASTKAAKLLIQRQDKNGDWKQECISGMFNKSCAISYTAYRNVFPIWALSRYSNYMLTNK